MKKNVLIIEDDVDISNLIKLQLVELNCHADMSHDGVQGLKLFKTNQYDMLILDIMLPGMNGLDICKAVRNMESYVPILMLTAKSTELDRVLGLELGADDYLTKPFSLLELSARIKALFRRVDAMQAGNLKHVNSPEEQKTNKKSEQQNIIIGDIEINLLSRSIMVLKKEIKLTAKEFDLLVFFAQHPGQVFTRTQLLDKVWGYGHDGYEHTVNSHINRLRAKVENNPAQPDYILTAWGVGYQFTKKL